MFKTGCIHCKLISKPSLFVQEDYVCFAYDQSESMFDCDFDQSECRFDCGFWPIRMHVWLWFDQSESMFDCDLTNQNACLTVVWPIRMHVWLWFDQSECMLDCGLTNQNAKNGRQKWHFHYYCWQCSLVTSQLEKKKKHPKMKDCDNLTTYL